MAFVPIDERYKACQLCGMKATLSAPEPIGHDCKSRGFGDSVAKLLHWLGFKRKKGCGCGKRQAALNKFLPY